MVVTVKAIYQDGVFKPLETLAVPDSQEVELSISWLGNSSVSENSISFASLKGIWSHLTEEDLNHMEAALSETRHQTATKLASLIHEFGESHRE